MPITPTKHIWMNGELVPFPDARIHGPHSSTGGCTEHRAAGCRSRTPGSTGRTDRCKTWNEYVHE